MTSREDILEDAVLISAVITNNLISSMSNNNGITYNYDKIKDIAIEFASTHTLVKDWNEYCDANGHSDWEEYVIYFATKKLEI